MRIQRIKSIAAAFFIILVLGAIVYFNSFAVALHIDDISHLVHNPALYHWDDPIRIFQYWPSRFVLFWTLALNYRVGGLNPAGYHLVNTFFHILSAFLVYLIFFRLQQRKTGVKSTADNLINQYAILAALVFLTHPLQTEAVTFIIQRGASLSGFFCLLSLYLYCRGRQDGSQLSYGGAWLAGLLGMFSKEGAAALPLLLGLWELFFGPKDGWLHKLKVLLPFAILPGFIVVAIWWTGRTGVTGFYYALNFRGSFSSVGMSGSDYQVSSRWVYLITQFRVLLVYIRALFVPVRQTFDYHFSVSSSIFQIAPLVSCLLLLSLITFARRLADSWRIVSFGIFFFLIALIPTSSIIVLLPLIAERHLYLALAGFAWIVPAILGRFLPGRWFGIAGAIIILCLAMLTHARNQVWLTPFTLWQNILKNYPRSTMALNEIGSIYIKELNFALAEEFYQKALLQFSPPQALATVYTNLAEAQWEQGKKEEALINLKKAIQICPGYPRAFYTRGHLHYRAGQPNSALRDYESALKLDPYNYLIYDYIGELFASRQRLEEAARYVSRAIELNPDFAIGYDHLGIIYANQGWREEARMQWRKALELDPKLESARKNLAASD